MYNCIEFDINIKKYLTNQPKGGSVDRETKASGISGAFCLFISLKYIPHYHLFILTQSFLSALHKNLLSQISLRSLLFL